MRQTRTRPFVHPDPVPPPLSLGSSLPTTPPLETSFEEMALIEMASPIVTFTFLCGKRSLGAITYNLGLNGVDRVYFFEELPLHEFDG